MLSKIFFFTFGCIILLLYGCSSYFGKNEHLTIAPQTLAQNSRMVLLSSQDSKLKIAARLTYLNEIDSSIFHGREYFFLEIFNDDENIVLPDSMQLTMFNRKPLWIRQINQKELDDMLVLENDLSDGYLIAFRRANAFEQKKIQIALSLPNYRVGVFDFSYILLKTKL
ncbi:hypothetical protein CQA53_08220 [Helicobacter didelphidarum]|uniref:Lipoprotein n=1 Tax=Helicobacter didelphidarum TaxID=2040648 RepID=A0A3D8IFW3_9HELI|nr:hypothetical protein [Helicobacter didelphidarum]RDU63594.1 hypothetical protein CQA53_08220 [Helicobacter didelphidarum]